MLTYSLVVSLSFIFGLILANKVSPIAVEVAELFLFHSRLEELRFKNNVIHLGYFILCMPHKSPY